MVIRPDGSLGGEFSWEGAKALAQALTVQANRAEEWAKAERVAMDAAILLRSGAPFGITDHPAIQAEAAKEAAWNRDLRRWMPGGVKSEEAVGTPMFTSHPNGGSK